jgi:hypothetical protein
MLALGLAPPERDLAWLHGLLDNRHQMVTHRIQIHLLAQGRGEHPDDFGCIILVAIKPLINRLVGPPNSRYTAEDSG